MLIYGYKGDKCLKSDNCDDRSMKNIVALKNYNEDLYNNYHWPYFDILLRHVYHTYTTLCKFNNSLVSTYEVNSNYIENIGFVKEYLEKNLDIENSFDNKCRNIYDHLKVWYKRLVNNPDSLDDIKWQVAKTMKYYEKQEIFRKASINLKRNYQDFVV